jgi:hypothetical protein
MPFKSQAQRRFMFAAESRGEIPKGTAKKWARHTPNIKSLPEHVKKACILRWVNNGLEKRAQVFRPAQLDSASAAGAGMYKSLPWYLKTVGSFLPVPSQHALPYASIQKAVLTNVKQSPGYNSFPPADTAVVNQALRRIDQGETAVRDTIPKQNPVSAGLTAKSYWSKKPEIDSALAVAARHFPEESRQASAYSVGKTGQGWNPIVRSKGPQPAPSVVVKK